MSVLQVNLDGLKQAHWSEQELGNATLVAGFVQELMNNHAFDKVIREYGNDEYVQHNRTLPDSMAGVVGFLEQFTKRFPDYGYDVKHIFADGDYIIFHSHVTIRKQHRGNDRKGLNIKDTWRIKDGKIVEHWDAVEPIDGFMRFYNWLTGGNVRNANGVF